MTLRRESGPLLEKKMFDVVKVFENESEIIAAAQKHAAPNHTLSPCPTLEISQSMVVLREFERCNGSGEWKDFWVQNGMLKELGLLEPEDA